MTQENGFVVSIVIPAWNEERLIAKTIQAVLDQDFPSDAFEVLVVDNNSSDNTASIAGEFANVQVLTESKQGVTRARERGRLAARGEIIAFLDSDSIPATNWLSEAVILFEDDAVVGLSGPYDYYDGHRWFRLASMFFQSIVYRIGHAIVHGLFRRGAIVIGGNMFARSSALASAGGINTEIEFYGDDTDTGLRLTRLGKVIFSPKLTVQTSARRFSKMGHIRVLMLYWINFVWTIVFLKPYSQR